MCDTEDKKIINVFHFQQHLHKIYRNDFLLKQGDVRLLDINF